MPVLPGSSDGSERSGASPDLNEMSTAELCALAATMKERERRLMELLRASAPERLEHDLRNVLNELVLLRTLFDPKNDA
jgi:hypothetical protein